MNLKDDALDKINHLQNITEALADLGCLTESSHEYIVKSLDRLNSLFNMINYPSDDKK